MTPHKILVTEDEIVIALDLQRRLSNLGYLVPVVAASGEEAIEQAASLHPDLLLMDIMLEGEFYGIETAKRICAQMDIPVIYLTANADPQTLKRVQESGAASYLLKPYRERELQISIEMALRNHELKQQLREANSVLERRVRERTADLEAANQCLRERAALLDETHDAIMVRDLDHRVRYWNCAAQHLYGWTAEEAIGKLIHDLILQGHWEHVPQASAGTLRDGEWSGEVTVFTKAGKRLTIQSRWTLLSNRDGQPHAFLIAHTDLTEQKLLEAKYLRAQRLESIGALASGIAHDLNNVFTPILMASQLIKDDPTAAGHASLLDLLHASARRGSDMVKQVLSFARGLDGGVGPIQIQHLLQDLHKMMRETFPRQIKTEMRLPADLWAVLGDATQLYQVFMNLCINARDAMPEGGVLKITAANIDLSQGDSRSSAHKPGPYVCITVADSGMGVPLEIQQRIFEPFFTTKENGKGTGLGLSTVRTIVATHAGFLEMESEVGAGTRFDVFLPAHCSVPSAGDAAAQEPPDGDGELVLFAEDESTTQEVVKATLEAHGYEVLLAGDGAEAVALYAANAGKIAVVITDMMMPLMDGAATIHALRRLNPDVKILAATGTPEKVKLANLESEESFPFLRKPYSQRTLLSAIHASIHNNGQAKESL
ncbi:MAG: response regulator [Limisphaerales bacterium]